MRYFTADTHFEHEGITPMMARVKRFGCLFDSSEEHDAFIVDQINKYVRRDDQLIIAGDFAWKKPGKWRQKIVCRDVRLVLGNHDSKAKCANVFGSVPSEIRTKAYNSSGSDYMKLFITHYPNFYWDGSHRGWAHLYGHVHSQREDYMDDLEPQRRSMDVGIDNAYRLFGEFRPFSEVEIYDYMARRSGHDDLRFYHDYQKELYIKRGIRGT